MLRHEVATKQIVCPVCGIEAATITTDHCCSECNAVLQWFQKRLVVSSYRPIDRISLTSSFAGDLATDSLDFIEIVCDLERDFDVAISGEEALKITNIGDAVARVRQAGATELTLTIAHDAPRRGLRIAPAGLIDQLSKIFGKIRKPR